MSAIIETLKKKYSNKKNNDAFPRQDDYNSRTQELLAQTYLRSGTVKKDDASSIKSKIKDLAPKAAIAAAVILILGIMLFAIAKYAPNIDITVIKRPNSPYINILTSEKVEPLIGAEIKRGYISLEFIPPQRPASVAINPKEYIDLTEKSLVIGARLKRGNGELRVILRDKNRRSYVSDTLYIKNTRGGRQNLVITGDKPKESIDIMKIEQIRIEFQNNSKQDKVRSVILLDKVLLVDNQ